MKLNLIFFFFIFFNCTVSAQSQPTVQNSQTVETDSLSPLSALDFQKIISSSPKVLVDIYAKWCGPCMKMVPDLEKLAEEFKGKVKVVRIDKDKNQQAANSLGVDELPTLFLFKDGKLIMTAIGYRDKTELQKLFEM
jgi:thioredoxin 1